MDGLLSINKLAFKLGISRQALEYVANNKSSFYRPYTKKQVRKDGSIKLRIIDNPNKAIRQIQKQINRRILRNAVTELPSYITGSRRNYSVKQNAAPHVNQPAVLLIDISNCFPSIDSSRVYRVYKERFGCSPPVARLLTKLTTFGDRLPQGAPTSPGLCNLVLAPMSAQLYALAKASGTNFTQYVDDLTFSGPPDQIVLLRPKALAIIGKHGFEVNAKKLKMEFPNRRMAVTSLVVNKGLSVGRRYIREIQRDILRNRSSALISGKIGFVRLVQKRRAKQLLDQLKRYQPAATPTKR